MQCRSAFALLACCAPGATACPVCASASALLGSVDFSKNCEERRGLRLPASGHLVEYRQCTACGHAFAPAFASWTPGDFRREIYNGQYTLVDPDWTGARARDNALYLGSAFGPRARGLHHLDYGGGDGTLSRLLREAGWSSQSCDPFVDHGVDSASLGRFPFITCFEVFEHVADPHGLVRDIAALLAPDGLLMFSTLVSDGELSPGQPPSWWYAAPRNGHISLFSSRSLGALARRHGFSCASAQGLLHLFWRGEFPAWARPLLGQA